MQWAGEASRPPSKRGAIQTTKVLPIKPREDHAATVVQFDIGAPVLRLSQVGERIKRVIPAVHDKQRVGRKRAEALEVAHVQKS